MPVNAKVIALGGLMLAFTEVCISLGSVIESNTLFLLAAASFLVGIMVRETGLRAGTSFCFAGVLLGFLITPNKLYVLSYAGMGFYILARETVWEKLEQKPEMKNRIRWFWLIKIAVFNVIYLAGIIGGWKLFFSEQMEWKLMLGTFVSGQIVFAVYDMAYEYVQRQLWTKMRKRLL